VTVIRGSNIKKNNIEIHPREVEASLPQAFHATWLSEIIIKQTLI
jgi:hypothetical protein